MTEWKKKNYKTCTLNRFYKCTCTCTRFYFNMLKYKVDCEYWMGNLMKMKWGWLDILILSKWFYKDILGDSDIGSLKNCNITFKYSIYYHSTKPIKNERLKKVNQFNKRTMAKMLKTWKFYLESTFTGWINLMLEKIC